MESQDNSTEKKILLKELQNNLPVEVKGKQDQSFAFKDWGMEEEKKIAKFKEKNPSMGRFITSILNLMLKDLYGEDFQGKEYNQKILTLNQMPVANVLYMYLFLRYDQLGSDINIVSNCPFCNNTIEDFTASLDDIDVDCKVGDYKEEVVYKLKKPVTLDKGEQLVENLKIGIAKWDVMEKADMQKAVDEAYMKETTFKSSIVGVDDSSTPVVIEEIIKKLKKVDIEFLNLFISKHNAGPTIQAEMFCNRCKQTFFKVIDWGYESFFGIGSLPTR